MERLRERNMSVFILSSLLNFAIGLAVGFIVGIVLTIANDGKSAEITMLTFPLLCGIIVAFLARNMYRIYFYYRLSLDVNAVCKGDGQETESFLLASVLSIITLGLYEVYWLYKLAKRLRANAPRYGFKMQETGKDIAVLSLFSFGYISAWELIKNINKVARVYNQIGLPELNVGGDNNAH